jgi:hypothetical protein
VVISGCSLRGLFVILEAKRQIALNEHVPPTSHGMLSLTSHESSKLSDFSSCIILVATEIREVRYRRLTLYL